ncbi:MAG: GNAT family N-acetyltransferase [Pseudomonadota bacterium]
MAAAYAPFVVALGDSLPVVADYGAEIAATPVWIAEADGRMVGALVLEPMDDHMRLANVAVLPEAQGRGIGRTLMEKAEAEAAAAGYGEMRLFTHAGMAGNIALYRRLGWTLLEPEPDSMRVAMVKRLDPDRGKV